MAGSAHFCSATNFCSDFLLRRDALFRSCAAISAVPDSLCFPFFTQAINEILSTSPCHCLVGFPLHPAIASFPLCATASTAHSLFCLAFLLPFVWFATARNDIAPSRLYSILSSLISFPICVHARKVRRETFPALFAHSLSRLHCCILLHLHHSISSLSSPLVATLCAA